LKRLFLILMLVSLPSLAAVQHPLAAVDTSSPRSLLIGYITLTNDLYRSGSEIVQHYRESGRLYLSDEEREGLYRTKDQAFKLTPAFDFSVLPSITRQESERRMVIQLKEVLDRVALPPQSEIPDAKAMKEQGKTRWQIPGTEIAIQQIESGPRKGDYIFAPDSIERLPEMYEVAKELPYVDTSTENWYLKQIKYPIGPMFALAKVIPSRWILNEATIASSKITFLQQPLWRWIGIVLIGLIVGSIGRSMFRLSVRLQERYADSLGFTTLIRPLTVTILSAISSRLLADVLRISDAVFLTLIPSLWALFFISLSWLFWNLGDVVSEAIIASERMIKGSINSQLTRFVMRLMTFTLVVATLVIGGQSLGLPAYSIIASIGVGGLAVALAAQHTLANLLASLIIMFEKPFIIGSRVKVSGQGGTVSSVGFRSTQILTDQGATISIPNDKVISGPIEADNTRPQNHVSATLSVPSRSPVGVIRNFLTLARDHLKAAEMVETPSINVGVSGLQGDKVEIHIEFILTGPFGERVQERKNHILLELLEIGHQSGIVGNGEAIAQKN
jgi:MscS family membrane protein